ncbi:MAG: twin-arginine translocase subunit TatC [Lewinella sp.]|nr:twin-arginine translocase subunit TatC [Lewinella sp.]
MALDQTDIDQYEWKDGELVRRAEDKEMSFLEHLEELRWHIIRSLVAIVIAGIGLYLVNDWYFEKILLGPTQPDFLSYRMFCSASESLRLGSALCFEPPAFKPIAIGFAEAFITSIKMSFVGGLIIAFPYVFWEIWRFVRPGLYNEERVATRGVVFVCSVLFLMGVLFGYFIIWPFGIKFLVGYTIPGVENTPALYSVINYMTMFTLPAGLIFELPIVVYFLSRIGLLTSSAMRKYRRHAIIGVLALAAILTPPDVVTQFLIGIPLFILYEISIFVAARAARQYQKELAD